VAFFVHQSIHQAYGNSPFLPCTLCPIQQTPFSCHSLCPIQQGLHMSPFLLKQSCSQLVVTRRHITTKIVTCCKLEGFPIIWISYNIERKATRVEKSCNQSIHSIASVHVECFLNCCTPHALPHWITSAAPPLTFCVLAVGNGTSLSFDLSASSLAFATSLFS
jgi:hypothetical protein